MHYPFTRFLNSPPLPSYIEIGLMTVNVLLYPWICEYLKNARIFQQRFSSVLPSPDIDLFGCWGGGAVKVPSSNKTNSGLGEL